MPRPWILAPLPALTLTLPLVLGLGACLRDSSTKGSGTATSNELQSRVANDDPRGVDAQPDWDRQARELKQRIDPRMPSELPTDKRATCEAMLDEVTTFYISVEGDPDQRTARMAQLQDTREADLQGCMEETSIAAAVCVTIRLKDRDSEFPWLLDQCSRAYPLEDEAEIVGALQRADSIELTFVGDVIFGRYREDDLFDPIIDPSKVSEKDPLASPFAEIDAQLRSDVVVGNLETPVIADLPQRSPINSAIRFGGDREDVQHLVDAGFSVMSLANNHYFDLRVEGQLQSPAVLADAGIVGIGASRTEAPVFRLESVAAKGWSIGFISLTNRVNTPVPTGDPSKETPHVPYLRVADMPDQLLPLVEQGRASHDLIVVVIHWGDEYAEAPSSVQQRTARALIDGGVDLVIGHHPHVLQGVEHYKHGVIAYSLGNFLFENTSAIPRQTGVLRTRWRGGQARACLDEVVFHPAYVKRSPYPHPAAATGGMAKTVRKRVVGQAKALGTDFVEIDGSEDLRVDALPAC